MAIPTVGDLASLLHRRYDPATAEAWDAVGLICGDPSEPAERVLFAVDPVAVVVDEAVSRGAQLLVTHHPLFLGGTTSVAASSAKGAVVHRLIRAGAALLAAHTNADHATPGVSDAIATALGLIDVEPLEPLREPETVDKILTMVPTPAAGRVLDALATAGAGNLGAYERAAFTVEGTGTFRPLPGANPAIGAIGEIERVGETQIQTIAPRHLRGEVVRALRAAHPYEEPAYDVIELAVEPSGRGAGRVGRLPTPTTLRGFARLVDQTLPRTAHGVRVAGDPARPVSRVALCGGSGASLLGTATATGADVYLTSDLKHHQASEHLESGGPALVDVAHWAAEWMWLLPAARLLAADAAANGWHIRPMVSTTVTDPWTMHLTSTNFADQKGTR
ncbi:MAG: Nif3-like dinuclear metal center hexameric protein [Candidatus Nanopelagicales bacterium]